jgi:hypothetical protein
MALPQINDIPKYELTIPSTQKTIRFRPFLVKEQKILLMALETQDQKQILNAVLDTMRSCIIEDIKLSNLTTFDVEYIFTKIRTKAVGETSKIALACTECDEQNELEINLDSINLEVKNGDKKIKLNDNYTIQLKYPTYNDVVNSELSFETATEQLYNTLITCLDKLITEEEQIEFKEQPKKDIEDFLESLTGEQMQLIMNFVENIPTLKYEGEFVCSSCNANNVYKLEGMQDFF